MNIRYHLSQHRPYRILCYRVAFLLMHIKEFSLDILDAFQEHRDAYKTQVSALIERDSQVDWAAK